MSTVLSNGVIVPDVGSTNWAADLETNWTLLNALIGAVGANVRLDRPNIWTAAQTFSEGIYGDLDGTAAMAVSDANGNEIATTYALKTDVTALANTVASKAADNAVVHLAGAETIPGDKTFTGTNRFGLSLSQKGFSPRASVPVSNEFGQFAVVDTDNNSVMSINYANRTTGVRDFTFRVYDSTGNVNGAGVFKDASDNYSFCSLDPNRAISLGNSGNQWASVYAQTYYYNGTAWGLDKSNVWTGLNTFSSASNCVFSFKFGSSGSYCDIRYYDSNDVQYATLRSKVNELVLGLKYSSASVWYNGASVTINNTGTVQIKSYDGTETWTVNFTPVGVYPTSNNALELGTSSNKWKTLNGINPGALCLQNFNAGITLDTTNWDKTGKFGADANFWTPTVNGWLTVLVNGTPGAGWVQLSQADSLGQFSICLSTGYAWATIPVVANLQCKIALLCTTVASAKFYPCLGNV